MENIIEQSFSVIFAILRTVRLYSSEDFSLSRKLQAYGVFFTFVILVPFLTFLNFLFEELDATKVNLNAAFIAQAVCFGIKLWPFVTRQNEIRRCIFYFEKFGSLARCKEQTAMVKDCIDTCRRNAKIFIICIVAGLPAWCVRPFFRTDYTFPMDIWLPLDFSKRPLTYYMVYIFVCVGLSVVTLTVFVDNLLSGLACHAAAQLRVLQYSLQHLGTPDGSKPSDRMIDERIKECIAHHTVIITFVNLYQHCFSFSIFSQLVAGILLLCVCILQLGMMQVLSVNALQSSMTGVIVLAQVYFYCYFGTLLFEENNGITNAIYMSRWYTYDLKSRKALVMMMECSKKPMVIVTGKLLTMSVETFTMILRRSYSLLAVLKNY